MKIFPLRSLSVRLPASLVDAIQHTAEARGATVSEFVRSALQAVVELDPAVRRHVTVLYEVAKTRALMVRVLDTQLDTAQVEQMLDAAEDDAKNYVHERVP